MEEFHRHLKVKERNHVAGIELVCCRDDDASKMREVEINQVCKFYTNFESKLEKINVSFEVSTSYLIVSFVSLRVLMS